METAPTEPNCLEQHSKSAPKKVLVFLGAGFRQISASNRVHTDERVRGLFRIHKNLLPTADYRRRLSLFLVWCEKGPRVNVL